jgi:hypothetical protein
LLLLNITILILFSPHKALHALCEQMLDQKHRDFKW